jgi:aryl-alcohol dehydrogenase-like predicted oxidoreductase
MAYGGADGLDEEAAALGASLESGVDLFDTAAFYSAGASERRLGELAAGRDVVIASKFPGGLRFKAEEFPEELEASLGRLGRSTIDLYQHHFPGKVSIPKLVDAMADAVEAGKVRAVGVSNYSAEQMRQAHAALSERGIPLASNQVEYSLLHRRPETNGVLDACRDLGVTLIAYTPLAGGMLTGKYTTANRPTGFYRRVLPRYRRGSLEAIGPVVQLLTEIGNRYSKSPSQVALRWLIENPTVLPIPGAKNGRQAAANAGALTFSLTADEAQALDDITLPWKI